MLDRESSTGPDQRFDCIMVGGGLASSLLALKLCSSRPGLRIALLEQSDEICGDHTWSFHDTDVKADSLGWLKAMVAYSWPTQEVRFPGYRRILATGYNTMTSSSLRAAVRAQPNIAVFTRCTICAIAPSQAQLLDGRVFEAGCVIDGRGADPQLPLSLGYQKFLGLEVELFEPHRLAHPIIMDATVPQVGGYRFVYSLPFSEDRVLLEDTYYADDFSLDGAGLEERVMAYAGSQGWKVRQIVRREQGVLPVVLGGRIADCVSRWEPGVPRVGLRACLFHPTTGYSLPDAVVAAEMIARLPHLTSGAVAGLLAEHASRIWKERRFYRLLNRWLFLAAEPTERVAIFERFYTLPQSLIERFYSGRLHLADKARILVGRPPVPIGRALRAAPEGAAWQNQKMRKNERN